MAILFSISLIFVLYSGLFVFFTKLIKSGILFLTAVRTVVAGKSVISGILVLTSFILALREVVEAKLVIPCLSFLILFILALRVVSVATLVIPCTLPSIILILALYTSF